MEAISSLFDETRLVLPLTAKPRVAGEVALSGHNLTVIPVEVPVGEDLSRKLRLPSWLMRNFPTIAREVSAADAVHTPIPGDLGTIGMSVAMLMRKPLFVRYCGNWRVRRTLAERLWVWLLQRAAGSRTVVLATGGGKAPPSTRNDSIKWIFATSLTADEIRRYRVVRGAPSTSGPRLVIACRQERKKGTGRVIASLRLLQNDYPGISFDVIGDGADLADFRALAEKCGVEHRVRFHGKLGHAGVLEVMRASDIFCFPTTSSEGFPKAVLEALACGLPVVSTRVSVLGDLLEGGGGVMLDGTTPEEIARAVRACVADPVHYRALSQAAVDTAAQYSLERWRDSIGQILSRNWGALRTNG